MDTQREPSAAERQYAAAHASHYGGRDPAAALRAYERIVTQHPEAPEAGYARAQIDNIVHQVVPAAELLAAKLELALRALRPDGATPAPVGV